MLPRCPLPPNIHHLPSPPDPASASTTKAHALPLPPQQHHPPPPPAPLPASVLHHLPPSPLQHPRLHPPPHPQRPPLPHHHPRLPPLRLPPPHQNRHLAPLQLRLHLRLGGRQTLDLPHLRLHARQPLPHLLQHVHPPHRAGDTLPHRATPHPRRDGGAAPRRRVRRDGGVVVFHTEAGRAGQGQRGSRGPVQG
ncbi:hypothetical protein BDZ85DRAFT_267982 [Elsinoe ampelina]|uniref:Uncharacterized protein n=1 Tax=Elsinoe ampelina TaxID=302913 RepID=A0A6A6G3L7_9PEZI|nr:hypothetical protein BDZ85DRAFT_267982 [Elsinoe ampelina]